MKEKHCRYRQVRAQKIIIAENLPTAIKDLFADRRYRVREIASMLPENIHDYIALHPPAVIGRAGMFHAIGNLRSVELLAYLDGKAKIAVLEYEPVSQEKITEIVIALEFEKLIFDAVEPLQFEQIVLAFWLFYQTQKGCPPTISTKKGLARLLSVNRRKFSLKIPAQLKSEFSGRERD